MGNRIHTIEEYINVFRDNGILAEYNIPEEYMNKIVGYISYNSQEVKPGTLFVCKGAHFKEEYLAAALKAGAFAYISEKEYLLGSSRPENIPYIRVTDIRKAMAYIANFYYNEVWKELCLIGITGTKGKSTTTYFMRYILDDYLKSQKKARSAIISGIENYDGVVDEESHLTTPEAMELHKHFNNAVRKGIEFLSMEVSSQALKYDRTLGILFDVVCFLNVGHDHISSVEHEDFEDYLESKLKLFKQCDIAVVNKDTDFAERVLEMANEFAPRVITFSAAEAADITGYDIVMGERETTFKAKTDSFDREFTIGMKGLFNVDNALAAIAISYALNIPLDHITRGLRQAEVPGRMEIFKNIERDLTVIVDYAHNQMSFEKLFASCLKEYPGQPITIVFGCPGKKAVGRRKELGEIAGKYADTVIITEEDAGEEPVEKISEEISSYVRANGANCEIIIDREKAIEKAIQGSPDHSIVLITGKGRETRQKRGLAYISTPSDVEIVKRLI